jgi:hypothetical protein
MSDSSRADTPHILRIGHEELVLRQRYELASISNDILVALWFIVGSVMFFSAAWTDTGVWCFLIGSVELLIRPVIRLARLFHIRRVRTGPGGPEAADGPDSAQDY